MLQLECVPFNAKSLFLVFTKIPSNVILETDSTSIVYVKITQVEASPQVLSCIPGCQTKYSYQDSSHKKTKDKKTEVSP